MFPVEAFSNSLRKIAGILRRHGIRFHLTGGITSVAYGEPRMTQDLDLVIDPDILSGCVDKFLQSLTASDFLFDGSSIRSAVTRQGMFQVFDKIEALKLDLYARELIPGELDRSQSLELFEGEAYPIVSRSDAALSKLVWVSKGSHKSRRDVRHIYRSADEGTRKQIVAKADEMQLGALLAELLSEPEEIE